MITSIEFYSLIVLVLMIMTSQLSSHGDLKKVELKIAVSDLIDFKLCIVVTYMNKIMHKILFMMGKNLREK